jgi:hypothetical protein
MSVFLTTNSDGFLYGSANALGLGAVCQQHLLLFCIAKELNVNVSIYPYKNIIGYADYCCSPEEWDKSFTEFFKFPFLGENQFDAEMEFNGSYDDLKSGIEFMRNDDKIVIVHLEDKLVRDIGQESLNIFFEKKYLKQIKDNLIVDNTYFSKDDINVSFHIRSANSGDIQSEILRHSREIGNVSDNFYRYKNIISHIKDKNLEKNVKVHIHSQGSEENFKDFFTLNSDGLEVNLHLNDHPINDIYHMSNADYLVMANSSYSWISHLLNSNTSYVRDNFWHTVYPNAIKIDYNYNII